VCPREDGRLPGVLPDDGAPHGGVAVQVLDLDALSELRLAAAADA